jgi:hypothetical protein
MLSSYKEIVYGVAFGVGAAALDTLIDARAAGESFLGEIGNHPGMILYRSLFVLFGLLLGWLSWKNNTRERESRLIMEKLHAFHQQYEAMAVVLHSDLQLLLTRNLKLPPEDEALLRNTYEKSRDLQAIARQRPAI